jgi:triphosphoribosyl-dephospho-CoA synthase
MNAMSGPDSDVCESGSPLSTAQCVTLAAMIEATAPKPGNVHRGADFEDVSFSDFILAAVAIGPIVGSVSGTSLGSRVLGAVQATRDWIGTNANLGIILLLSPLAMVRRNVSLSSGVADVLGTLTPDDARQVYEAIRLAKPGGLGRAAGADVHGDPPQSLVEAMRLGADRDMVARQYANGFDNVLNEVAPLLVAAIESELNLSRAIVSVHLQLIARYGDSLIARKCGPAVSQQAAARAAAVLECGEWDGNLFQRQLADFDFWLRSDGHRRNPGTTADLIAAGLFVLLRDGILKPPFRLADQSED